MKRKRGNLVTIGSFDGVHRGHQALLTLARHEAKKRGLKSLAITFKIPPRMVLNQENNIMILSDPSEKEFLIHQQGIDEVQTLPFGKKFSQIKPFSFFREYLVNHFKARGIVVGSDFRFGLGRSAGALELVRWGQEYEIPVWVVPPVKWHKRIISSSFIRQFFESGRFAQAVDFLGHPYLVQGPVIKGKGWGRQLGFPTANIKVSEGKCLPKGVFVVLAYVGGKNGKSLNTKAYKGVCNIGYRPTMGHFHELSVEVHLFGRPGSLETKYLRLELLHQIRKEKRFKSRPDLIRAISRDVAFGKRYFRSHT